MLARIYALWLLAWSLLRTTLAQLLFPKRRGLQRFQDNFAEDRLLPMNAEHRARLPSFSTCIACGQCDHGQGRRIASSAGRYRGMMSFVLSASRSMPDFDAAMSTVRDVPEAELARLEGICPAGVPFRSLAGFVRSHASQLQRATAGSSAPAG